MWIGYNYNSYDIQYSINGAQKFDDNLVEKIFPLNSIFLTFATNTVNAGTHTFRCSHNIRGGIDINADKSSKNCGDQQELKERRDNMNPRIERKWSFRKEITFMVIVDWSASSLVGFELFRGRVCCAYKASASHWSLFEVL